MFIKLIKICDYTEWLPAIKKNTIRGIMVYSNDTTIIYNRALDDEILVYKHLF